MHKRPRLGWFRNIEVVGRMPSILRAIWHFRYFIVASVRAEFSRRFARSRLGALWSILNPLAQAAIFAIALSEVIASKLPGVNVSGGYAIYLMAGTAAWSLFGEITGRCMTIFLEYRSTLRKIAFPRLCLPIIVGSGALINHLLLLAATTIVFLFMGRLPTAAWLVIPLGTFLILLFGFGLGVMLGIFNVFVRDVGQVFTVVIQLWFWLTPIIYTPDTLPPKVRWLSDVNPMAALVRIYQDAMLYDRLPNWHTLLAPTLFALALFGTSFLLFKRASSDLVDAL